MKPNNTYCGGGPGLGKIYTLESGKIRNGKIEIGKLQNEFRNDRIDAYRYEIRELDRIKRINRVTLFFDIIMVIMFLIWIFVLIPYISSKL